MSVFEILPNLTEDGTNSLDLTPWFSKNFSVYLAGSIGGGTFALQGGDADGVAPVQVLNPYDGTWTPYVFGASGVYHFEVVAQRLDFVLSGATSPIAIAIVIAGHRR